MRFLHSLWLVLIPVWLCSCLGLASGQCGNDQKSLLLELKNRLDYNSTLSSKLVMWNSSSDAFAGVLCEGGRVIELDLSNETLIGGINGSSGLFRLQYQRRLNLAYNRFPSLGIPMGLSNLSDLVYLNLSNIGFVGQVPMELSQLTRLVVLDLSTLSFPGQLQLKLENPNLKMLLGNFKQLRELYLDGVAMPAREDEWCRAISSTVPKLEVLSMANCNLSGPIDRSLLNLSALSVIRLSSNNLSSTVPEFLANFHNLTALRLSSCGLKGVFPAKIFKNPTLQTLDVSNNQFLMGSLPEFPRDSSLQTLVLSKTNMSGRLPVSIGTLGNLRRLEFPNCGFTGSIPISVGNISQLTYLDLSRNNLSGTIPPLNLLRNLKQIILSYNNLTGEIGSTSWDDLRMLENVDMRNNLFKGSIPFSLFTLPRIHKIQLSNNQFSGKLIESSNGFPYNLDTLDLSENKLQGAIPGLVFLLTGLKYLSLRSNDFSGSLHINTFQKLKNLSYLDLSYNQLSINATGDTPALNLGLQLTTFRVASCQLRILPKFLAHQKKLIYLDLSDNQIQGKIPKWMWELKNILYLNLSCNKFDEMVSPPHNLSYSLQVLDLHKNCLQGQFLPFPQAATFLDYSDNNFSLAIREDIGSNLAFAMYVSLARNHIHGAIPTSICKAPFLQVLDLSNNSLGGAIPECMMMDSLKILNLRHNRLHGNIPSNIKATCGLRTLDVNSNQLEGGLPRSLQSCSMLEVLDIGNNNIRDKFPCHLTNISYLRVLVLRSNEFYGEIDCSNASGTWKMLLIVDLSRNNFSGVISAKCLLKWDAMKRSTNLSHLQYPYLQLTGLYYQDTVRITIKGLELEIVKILTLLTSIDFSCNNFEGPMPDSLGELQALYNLNMSHNSLSGRIPSSIGNLPQLESLDLSSNNLSGTIPDALSNLNFLGTLNLSYNQLVGKIPTAKQFATFLNTSFEGNPGLCGQPLTKICSNPHATAPANPNHKQNSLSKSFNLQFILAGLGFGTGAAAVITPLTFWDKGRTCCNDQVDKILLMPLPMIGLTYRRPNKDDEDNPEDHNRSDSDFRGEYSYDHEDGNGEMGEGEEEAWGRYCVVCTKLETNMKRVFHDPRCTCYDTLPISPSYYYSCSSSSSSSPSITTRELSSLCYTSMSI